MFLNILSYLSYSSTILSLSALRIEVIWPITLMSQSPILFKMISMFLSRQSKPSLATFLSPSVICLCNLLFLAFYLMIQFIFWLQWKIVRKVILSLKMSLYSCLNCCLARISQNYISYKVMLVVCSLTLSFSMNSSIFAEDLFTSIKLLLRCQSSFSFSLLGLLGFQLFILLMFTFLHANISCQDILFSWSLSSMELISFLSSKERTSPFLFFCFRTGSLFFMLQKYQNMLLQARDSTKNGCTPSYANWYMTHPREYTSTLEQPFLLSIIYGAMQRGLPLKERFQMREGLVTLLERPKSAILNLPSLRRMFQGLISLWMRLASKRTWQPLQIWEMKSHIFSSGISFISLIYFYSDPPLQYSIMMQRLFSLSMCAFRQFTKFYCRGSSRMIDSSASIDSRLSDQCRLMTLATRDSLGWSLLQAIKTSPKLPFPSFSSSETKQGVPWSFLTLTLFLFFIDNQQNLISLLFIVQLTVMSRVNQTSSGEIKKIFCAYHPNEFLTNFCCDSDCLMPLCPNCIVEHTEQHFLENNKPVYVNLQEAIAETKQKCYQHIVVFEELNRSNDKIYDYLTSLRESIHNQLMEDKEEIIRELDSLFELYEDKIYNDTVSKYKESQVYDKKETANINTFITEQIETLHDQISILKGDNCLAGLITYYANDSKIYENSLQELKEYIDKHKKAGKILINTDGEKVGKTFQNFCENNLVVEFITEEMQKKQEEEKLNESRQSNSILGRLGRKKGQSYSKENNMNHNNSDYRNKIQKSQEYYKIDPLQQKYSRIHHSKATLTANSRPYSLRHNI